MSSAPLPTNDRLLDLLGEQATIGLPDAEYAELERLLSDENLDAEIGPDELTEAAAACSLMWLDPREAVPASARAKLIEAAERHISGESSGLRLAGTPADRSEPLRANPLTMWGGWVAAAACLIVAVVLSTPSSSPSETPGPVAAVDPNDPAVILARVEEAPDATHAAWLGIDQVPPLAAEAPHRFDEGISGEVIWSEELDQGVMRISGLTENDPAEWVYQLWIFDKTRDDGTLAQRPVDGGVFDFSNAKRDPKTGDVLVPINAKLPVGEAFLFAVTVEPPGGVVVSDRDIVFVAAVG
jgi:hypothetical protein